MSEAPGRTMLSGLSVPEQANENAENLHLHDLAEQLAHIAAQLRRQGGSGDLFREPDLQRGSRQIAPVHPPLGGRPTRPITLEQARAAYAEAAKEIYSTRRRRTAIFGNPELFGEPAWDILLDLYIAHVDGKQVSVSSACIGSAAPPTTGLRWLGVLAEQDLILREHDPEDQRRVLVRLTERGLMAMDKYFASSTKSKN